MEPLILFFAEATSRVLTEVFLAGPRRRVSIEELRSRLDAVTRQNQQIENSAMTNERRIEFLETIMVRLIEAQQFRLDQRYVRIVPDADRSEVAAVIEGVVDDAQRRISLVGQGAGPVVVDAIHQLEAGKPPPGKAWYLKAAIVPLICS